MQDDGLEEAVLLEVEDELAELAAVHLHEWEQGGSRVELGGGGRRGWSGVGSVGVLM